MLTFGRNDGDVVVINDSDVYEVGKQLAQRYLTCEEPLTFKFVIVGTEASAQQCVQEAVDQMGNRRSDLEMMEAFKVLVPEDRRLYVQPQPDSCAAFFKAFYEKFSVGVVQNSN